ncbi:MAG: NAD-dependent epimerase/dehydratase family protein [Pseudonocardia sp.]|uniref:NAD-dependent epimerase/dehydratase family protein n=1 Tax=unclassified Pseudonocardia TaxID=2619320 RepID=UPI00086B3E1B|nr:MULTISPECIES: NAD-dependent epimerase/dehydratase family protein [unclassified Pseudonocardia]MBN9107915.1 NAD-dependent epimerase/dehydratase family protein [Pseudonocardia sp.]ODU25878.1 MAG: UDP-glucose 4-epimerase [Pseudonocardia sp. SCN 72-51]ODV07399.1 MAG: UDP-glucose 4-epimerase [Pseudonocardia sp. SCN 73-27]
MRVLLTGGLGVNGSWVVRRLVETGHDVVVLDNRDDRSLVPDLADDLTVAVADVSDSVQVRAVFEQYRPETVVHMAAIIGADRHPVAAVQVNIAGTAAVCEAAAVTGVGRVVYTSSRAAYGALTGPHGHPDYVPITEDHPLNPVALYDVTKMSCEEIGRWYARNRGIEYVSLRFATIFGPGKLARHGGFSAYSSMIELPAAGEAAHLGQGGDQRDDAIYVADIADAVIAATLAPGRLPHDVYNIGTGRTVSLHELAEAVRDAIPGATIEIGPGLDPMGMGISYYGALDSSRAHADLGWKPRFDVRDAVGHYLATLDRLDLAPHRTAAGQDEGHHSC